MKHSVIATLLLTLLLPLTAVAQLADTIRVNPDVDYSRTPGLYRLAGINIRGASNYDQYTVLALSGLSQGQQVKIPGEEISQAVRRYWRNGFFSNVRILVDSIKGRDAYITIALEERPRVSEITYTGVKKKEREELSEKLGLIKEAQLTPNMVDRCKILAKRYFDDKGFKNAEIQVIQREDLSNPGRVRVEIAVDKREKVKVHRIYLTGVEQIKKSKILGNLFKNGAMKKTHELKKWFRSSKFVPENYKADKENIIEKYNEFGFRDARIVADSVVPYGENKVDIYITLEEGRKYYVRNIDWVGNTIYATDYLSAILRMKKGDVYDQTLLRKRLSEDDDAVGNEYQNHGYLFYQLDPTEVNVVGDSIDLEMRITEGPQATINKVTISGNDRLYEDVVRRELRTKPGDLFSKDAMMRTYREIASMGHFDPEAIQYDLKPNQENGTVDLSWGLSSKSNDQVEFSLGYGQTGVIGKIGLKFTNFSMGELFRKNGLRRGILPQGNGETFSISGQTNGRYYQSYSIQYLNPWFGGKRPNSLSISAFFSRSTDVSDTYYNSAYYNNYYNYMYGYGNSGYNSYYQNYYDPDKYINVWGFSIGWGKRLRWPDDYFTLTTDLSYTRYDLKNWSYFLVSNGSCNNIALNIALRRSSTDNNIYPRSGSEFELSLSITPPYSLWDGIDYKNLATNYQSATYQEELQKKYRFIEYHKWKFKFRNFTALTGGNKCPVLMTRVEFGLLGSYNKYKKSPFETYYMGGDGTSGYSSTYATETVGLRGYENGSLTPQGYTGYAYSRMTLELRYPLMMSNSTNIFALAFVEGGNAWDDVRNFNPFNLKRSAGVGVRVFLPMIGLLGIDWAYGFDKVWGQKGGSNFHFILGQEF